MSFKDYLKKRLDEMNFTNRKEFEDHPCSKCHGTMYMRVDGSPDEESGWECANCGKEFIRDEDQDIVNYNKLPQSMRDTLYIDRD